MSHGADIAAQKSAHNPAVMSANMRTAHKPHINRPFPARARPLHHPRIASSKFEAGAIRPQPDAIPLALTFFVLFRGYLSLQPAACSLSE